MNARTPIPKTIAISSIFIALFLMVGGYALYYHGEKRVAQKDREMDALKEKTMHAEENYNELKKKFESNVEELNQVNKDYEIILQKHQECKEKQEELQTKYDVLEQKFEQNKKALGDAQTKLGITPDSPHPVQMLNKANEENTTPVTTDSETLKTQAKTNNCPTPEIVTKNINSGTWQDDKMTWWVDFTKRPLNENESVKELFKILYDGQSIACYYALEGGSDNVWMVVKGNSKDKKTLIVSDKGWAPCPTDECKFICEKTNLEQCTFSSPNE